MGFYFLRSRQQVSDRIVFISNKLEGANGAAAAKLRARLAELNWVLGRRGEGQ